MMNDSPETTTPISSEADFLETVVPIECYDADAAQCAQGEAPGRESASGNPQAKDDEGFSPEGGQGECADEGPSCNDAQARRDAAFEGEGEDELESCRCECHNQEIGRRGEDAAVWYLERRGYQILERNWKCYAGEADIIALDGDSVVFVEVKTRTNTRMGFPEEAVGKEKRARYEKIAACYLAETTYVNVPVRFDVVALLVIGMERALVKHHVNAFGVA